MPGKKKNKEFTIGQMVKFYVIRFRKWYEGKVEKREEREGLVMYDVRVTKAPANKWGINEVGNLWLVENNLMEAL